MASASAGNSTLGIPKAVGQEFMASDTGGKLPEKVKNSRSEKMYGKKKVARHG
jgi:hypothetical protein